MTRPVSSQIMSPIGAQLSTDVDDPNSRDDVSTSNDQPAQRLAETVEFARVFTKSDQQRNQVDTPLSHADAEHLDPRIGLNTWWATAHPCVA